jgi:acetolactate synthase I/II/III large subunit
MATGSFVTVRGADALAQALLAAGVRRVFTLSGNHIMPVFDAALSAGIELVHTRHEAAAVHMADAWARMTGEVGVALVTGGPGHANAVAALYTAAMAESPVVLLSGHAPLAQLGMGAFQEMRQADIAAPLTKASWTTASADDVAADLRRAMEIALSGRPGAVHLSLPVDCLEAEIGHRTSAAVAASGATSFSAASGATSFSAASGATNPSRHPGRPVGRSLPRQSPSRGSGIQFIDYLRKAKRPLILTGPASLTKRGRERMARVEAALGVPVIGMESPRGIADPSLGAFAGILAQADHVLLLGKRLDFTLGFGAAPAFAADCEFAQIDAEPAEFARTRRAVGERLAATSLADAFCAAEGLIEAARQPMKSGWLEEVRTAVAYRPPAWDGASPSGKGRMHPVQACRPLQALLDAHPDSVFVSDGGEIGQWAQACLSAPHRIINGVAGSIGAALPFALAARLAQPEAPVIALMGDGTFGFHCAEIDTAVRYRLPFVAVVGNDARWNAEYQIQLREYGRERIVGTELLPARYDLVAAGFGGYGELVTDAREVLPAARRARESGLPACLNVMIEGLPAPNIRR